jgi:uncharacterized protein (DUF58 family)
VFVRPGFWAMLGFSLASMIGSLMTNSLLMMRMFYLGILLTLVCLIWTLFSLRGIGLERKVRGFRQQLGQVLEERFELFNGSHFLKLWVQVDDSSELPQSSGSRVLAQIKGKEHRSFSTHTLLTHRGLFHFGSTVVSSGDPIGLFGARKKFSTSQTVLVLPYMVQLSYFPFPAGILPGGKALRRKTQEVTPHAAGVREYAPGDSLSRIHWPITVRKDKFMVKEFDQDPQADVWIFLDGEKSVQSKLPDPPQPKLVYSLWALGQEYHVTLPQDTFEYAVSVAASIAHYFLKLGEAVGLACAGQITLNLPAEKGERQLGKIFETLAYIESEGKLPLQSLVDVEIQHISRGSTVVIISTTNSKSVSVSVERLIRRDIHPIVIMIDSNTFSSEEKPTDITKELGTYQIPVIMIQKDDDLRRSLENG